MHPDRLFLARCQKLAILKDSEDEIDVLDTALILRKFLYDTSPLIDTVNKKCVKIRYTVPKKSPELISLMGSSGMYYSSLVANEVFSRQVVSLNKKLFLSYELFHSKGSYVTVQDVIKHAVIVAGAVHHTPNPKEEFRIIAERLEGVYVGHLPMRIHLLSEISEVVLKGIDPLITLVKKRHGL